MAADIEDRDESEQEADEKARQAKAEAWARKLERRGEALRLRNAGMSYDGIARKLGTTAEEAGAMLREAIEDMAGMEQGDPAAPEADTPDDPDAIAGVSVESCITRGFDPFVRLTVGKADPLGMGTDEARKIGADLIEAAAAAQTDAILMKLLVGSMKAPEICAAMLLRDMRRMRDGMGEQEAAELNEAERKQARAGKGTH